MADMFVQTDEVDLGSIFLFVQTDEVNLGSIFLTASYVSKNSPSDRWYDSHWSQDPYHRCSVLTDLDYALACRSSGSCTPFYLLQWMAYFHLITHYELFAALAYDSLD